ncbi:MAG: Anaerobic nitric oxide reductase transcription regulator NorR [Candidatus Udaeobacter sp.]|nr:MAG: Anaerobic nitric oxide reductase transcription regulator NorR [Candidatus Udaeobacter sp.]
MGEDRAFERVGGNQTLHADADNRCTNKNLEQLVREGKFRDDLYFRLHVHASPAPPLRERKEDIPILVRGFCATSARQTTSLLSISHPMRWTRADL